MASYRVHYLLEQAIERVKPDVVMMLRVQQERMSASFFPTKREYARVWGINKSRLSQLLVQTQSFYIPGP